MQALLTGVFLTWGGVLQHIESDFEDFLTWENLRAEKEVEWGFKDIKYKIRYNHDMQEDLKKEYEQIRGKYLRRIAWFREAVTRPTCFFRTVRDDEEVAYINENWEHIEAILKRSNPQNRIVYIVCANLEKLTECVQAYYLITDKLVNGGGRHLFDTSKELLEFCANCMGTEQIQKNKQSNFQIYGKGVIFEEYRRRIYCDISGIDTAILHALNVFKDEGIYIWGAGKLGMPLARYFCERGVVLKGIIDNNISEKTKEGFELVSFDEVEDGAKIFISVYDDKANEEILEQIHKTHKKTTAVGYEDLKELFD